MKLRMVVVGLLLAAPALEAQGRACAAPSMAQARRELDSALVHYDSLIRWTQGDSIAAMYTPDGQMLGTNVATVQGPDSIAHLLARYAAFHVDSEDMRPEATTIADTEAIQWGTWRQAVTPPGRDMVHVQGRFVAHWIRGCDGRWRLRRLLTQPTPP
jgi:ketosteroid isomerase-like protein